MMLQKVLSLDHETDGCGFTDDEDNFDLVYHAAALKMREELAQKFNDNFIVGEKQHDSLEILKTQIAAEYKSDIFTEEIKHKYLA